MEIFLPTRWRIYHRQGRVHVLGCSQTVRNLLQNSTLSKPRYHGSRSSCPTTLQAQRSGNLELESHLFFFQLACYGKGLFRVIVSVLIWLQRPPPLVIYLTYKYRDPLLYETQCNLVISNFFNTLA